MRAGLCLVGTAASRSASQPLPLPLKGGSLCCNNDILGSCMTDGCMGASHEGVEKESVNFM